MFSCSAKDSWKERKLITVFSGFSFGGLTKKTLSLLLRPSFIRNNYNCFSGVRESLVLNKATPKAMSLPIIWHKIEAHSEPTETSKMEFFCEISWWLKAINYFRKNLHLRYLSGFWIFLCKMSLLNAIVK